MIKNKKYLKIIIGIFVSIGLVGAIYGGVRLYRYNKTYNFYYDVCMGLKDGYDKRIVQYHMKHVSANDLVEKRSMVTEKNCKCVAKWHSRTLYRKYILDLMDRIQDNIEYIRDYDTLLDGMFNGNITRIEQEVFSHVLETEIHLKDCATIGFEGMVRQLEGLIQSRKSELNAVGVGHMYKAKSYNVLN